jgi:hypothetical protein
MVPSEHDSPAASEGTPSLSAQEWFRRFREEYSRAAESPLTALGLFYDRHRRFADFQKVSDPSHPEYTDEQWDRVMADFLASLSGDLGLFQPTDWEGRPNFEWFWPSEPQRAAVTIRPVNNATNTILTQDVPEIISSNAELSVLVMYPDYPNPPGTEGIEEATRAWSRNVELVLHSLRPSREFLLMTISAYSWDLPAPWKGYVWNSRSARLEEAP